jgi:hypothetical protein
MARRGARISKGDGDRFPGRLAGSNPVFQDDRLIDVFLAGSFAGSAAPQRRGRRFAGFFPVCCTLADIADGYNPG